MGILRVLSILLPFCYSIFCYPSKPLNERSTEFTWQAWLLVDDQNQNKHYDSESFTRRRITPKSVFIAPTFSPESLPACADGYRPDSMGRCIKIIKLDEEAHLDFLLQKLNAQFGSYDDLDSEDDSQEDLPTAGPFQLNIPLDGSSSEQQTKKYDKSEDKPDEVDIAIVVAPTNGNFGLETIRTTHDNTNPVPVISSQTQMNASDLENPHVINSKRKTEGPVTEMDTTTSAKDATIENTSFTTTETSTTLEYSGETPTALSLETTTPEISTEALNDDNNNQEHALFFINPTPRSETHNADAEDDSVIVSTHKDGIELVSSNLGTIITKFDTTNIKPLYNDSNSTETTTNVEPEELMLTSENTNEGSGQFIRFPTTEEETTTVIQPLALNHEQLLPHEHAPSSTFRTNQLYHVMNSPQQAQSSENPDSDQSKIHNIEQLDTSFDEYLHSRGVDLQANERFLFKNRNPDSKVVFNANSQHQQHGEVGVPERFQQSNVGQQDVKGFDERVFNHRNRDKSNLWHLPSSWSQSSPQKPIVLRFSRRSGASRHLLHEHSVPWTQETQTFYREVPTEDFSYIFGGKSNQNWRRNHR